MRSNVLELFEFINDVYIVKIVKRGKAGNRGMVSRSYVCMISHRANKGPATRDRPFCSTKLTTPPRESNALDSASYHIYVQCKMYMNLPIIIIWTRESIREGLHLPEFYRQITSDRRLIMSAVTNTTSKEIIDSFQSGLSIAEISEKFGTFKGNISWMLEKAGVRNPNKGRKSKYSLREDFFSSIDDPFKAYFLGLMCADGSVKGNGYGLTISLQEADRRILDIFRRHLHTDRPLRYTVLNNENWSNTYTLDISSRQMNSDFVALGRTNDKSKFHFPTQIPDELKRYFILGYFDGDGSISTYLPKSGSRRWSVKVSSNNPFLKELADYIEKEVGISAPIYKDHRTKSSDLMIRGNHQIRTFLDWLYEDTPVFLDRKRDKYIQFLNYCDDIGLFEQSVHIVEEGVEA